MRLVCAPLKHELLEETADLKVVLFSQADQPGRASGGGALAEGVRLKHLQPSQRAWDLLSIALSVIVADTGVSRDKSPDGWTRDIDLTVAVDDGAFWASQRELIARILWFLTTDRWSLSFVGDGAVPPTPRKRREPAADSVVLLSGGLDSLVGAIDLTTQHNRKPFAVSQIATGDRENQRRFAALLGGGLEHLQLNHNADCPGVNERSQRARSLAFLAYGVLAATTLRQHLEGGIVTLYACENGFISVNPPLTTGRLGSLSTRTTHPTFLRLFQLLLNTAGLRVKIENPYQFKTKGEMLLECSDQALLRKHARTTTSCGRFARNGYRHCGRCVPCLIRRAAFRKWRVADRTVYVYRDIGIDDANHARFDDVRSVAIALAEAKAIGIDAWLGASLTDPDIGEFSPYRDTVARGLEELEVLLKKTGVK